MARGTGDSLRQHAPRKIKDAGRQVASFAHGCRERGTDQGLGLLFDNTDQPVPDNLALDGCQGAPGHRNSCGCLMAITDKVTVAVAGYLPLLWHDERGLVFGNYCRTLDAYSGDQVLAGQHRTLCRLVGAWHLNCSLIQDALDRFDLARQ